MSRCRMLCSWAYCTVRSNLTINSTADWIGIGSDRSATGRVRVAAATGRQPPHRAHGAFDQAHAEVASAIALAETLRKLERCRHGSVWRPLPLRDGIVSRAVPWPILPTRSLSVRRCDSAFFAWHGHDTLASRPIPSVARNHRLYQHIVITAITSIGSPWPFYQDRDRPC